MARSVNMKAKVCLVGEPAVGKTSLIRRFVEETFEDAYVATLKAKFSKKELVVEIPERDLQIHIDMVIWDIMGDKGFRELLREAYFYGAQGVLAACDITRKGTLEDLETWVESVTRTVGEVPWVLAVNKFDLAGHHAFGEERARVMGTLLDAPHLFTSAKTGEGVEEAFQLLGRRVVEHRGIEEILQVVTKL